MVKLTGIFKINKKVGEMVEIVRTVLGVSVYTLVHESKVNIEDNGIYISNEEVNRLNWFFKKIKNIF